LEIYDCRGLLSGVWAAVADNVVRGHFCDGLNRISKILCEVSKRLEHTPSYEGTRTPSPTAPLFTLTMMVCAEADDAAATRAREVESFILRICSAKDDFDTT
jgi:hypothetical protein